MASIKTRPNRNGTFSFLITVSLGRDAEGKKQIKTTTFTAQSKTESKARNEAKLFALKYEDMVLSGDILADENISFEGFVQIWEKNWLPAKTPGVRQNYKDALRLHVLPFIGDLKLKDIRATHIDNLISIQKNSAEAGAAASVRKTFTAVNSVFKYALKKQYVRENPCTRCDDLPTIQSKTGNDLCFFNQEQARRFLKEALTMEYPYTCKAHKRTLKKTGETYTVPAYSETRTIPYQWRVYFAMAIYGQFRRGEMCALTWKDIDFKNHIISINKAVVSTKAEGRIVKEPKTKAGIRDVAMPSDLFEMLSQWKKDQMSMCVQMGTAWKGHRNGLDDKGKPDSFEDNEIFIQLESGLPIDPNTPSHKFREIVDMYNATRKKEEDKLPHIRLHDLRHTGATLLLAKNTDIETVSRRLGHSKASVTLDIYGHALPENDKQASDTLEAMFV